MAQITSSAFVPTIVSLVSVPTIVHAGSELTSAAGRATAVAGTKVAASKRLSSTALRAHRVIFDTSIVGSPSTAPRRNTRCLDDKSSVRSLCIIRLYLGDRTAGNCLLDRIGEVCSRVGDVSEVRLRTF